MGKAPEWEREDPESEELAIAEVLSASNAYGLHRIFESVLALKERGLYEQALLRALIAHGVNNSGWPLGLLRQVCKWADPARLRAAGDPLPGPGPFTLYRGVAGRTSARRVRGISWTASLEKARWFANRFHRFADPGVYRVTVSEGRVVAYSNARQEEEFIVLLEPKDRVERIE